MQLQPKYLRYGFWIIALALLASGLLAPPPISQNDASRWNTIWSLAHHGSYAWEGVPFSSVDAIWRNIDGKEQVFSRKPAFVATAVTPVYMLLKLLGFEIDARPVQLSTTIVLMLVNLIPFLVCLRLFYLYLEASSYSPWVRYYALLACALGTYLTGYLWTLNNHLFAGLAVSSSIYCLWRYRTTLHPMYLAGTCGLAALAAACEIPAGLFLIAVCGYFLWQRDYRNWVLYGLSTILGLGMLYGLIENSASGHPLPYLLRQYLEIGISDEIVGRDVFSKTVHSVSESKWAYGFNTLLGHHGLFSLSPIFAISTLGLARWKQSDRFISWLLCSLVLCTVTVATLYILKTRNYGGLCHGFRWFMWLAPIFLYALPEGATWLSEKQRWLRGLMLALLAVSIYSALSALPNPWSTSWLNHIFFEMGWVSYLFIV